MKTLKINNLLLALTALLMTACSGVPDHVIQPEKMATLMADIHTAESVVEFNYQNYPSDSTRKVLKQSVLAHNGVTQDQLDTSLVWYGAHLDKYQDVYERTEEILEERLRKSDAVVTAQAQLSVSGDSVDVWGKSRRYIVGPQSPATLLTFRIKADKNNRQGDSYTWRAKFFNPDYSSHWVIVADYQDGSTEVLNSPVMGEGWQSLTFFTDSTRVLRNIYGTLESRQPAIGATYIDSIQLVRNRLNANAYPQRYRQRTYENGFGK